MVLLVCGENDLAEGTSVAATFARYSSLVDTVRAAGARVIYMGTKPEPKSTSLHAEYVRYDQKIRELATSLLAVRRRGPRTLDESAGRVHGSFLRSAAHASGGAARRQAGGGDPPLTMVDVYNGFEALVPSNPASLYASDGLHLSTEGYAYWETWAATALADPSCAEWLGGACVQR